MTEREAETIGMAHAMLAEAFFAPPTIDEAVEVLQQAGASEAQIAGIVMLANRQKTTEGQGKRLRELVSEWIEEHSEEGR